VTQPNLLEVMILLAALGTGLVAGVFYAFSTFVMKALGNLPAAQGVAAMQSINLAVINPWFLGAFFGTGLLCIVLIVLVGGPAAAWLVAGALLYLVGTIVVTMAGNVPLNNALARVDPATAEAATLWARYLSLWTRWNHLRTAAALAASAAFIVALWLMR
jgi:uncharacterized membrane protein